jgi:hypothetical protein
MYSDDECIICLESLYSKDQAILSCNHVFHYKCIGDWIKKKKNYNKICPLCDNYGEIINIIEVPKKKTKDKDTDKGYYFILEDVEYEQICCCNIL